MKTVLHVIYHARFGGIEKVVFDILNHQSIAPEISQDLLILKPEGEYLTQFEKLPIKIHHGKFKSGFDLSLAKIRLMKATMSTYDLLHFHVFHLPTVVSAIAAKIKIVYTEHGNFGFGRKVRFVDRVNHFFKGIFLRKYVSLITYNSNFTQGYARQKYTIRHGREQIVYNGVDFEKINSMDGADSEVDRSFFNIGTISRLAGFKRIDRLIAAFARFASAHNDVRLYIGGDGLLKNELKLQVKEMGIVDKVIFTGYLKNATGFMEQMDVCVFPSKNEPFGIVAVEALSKSRPVLVFADGGGLVEIIERNNPDDIVADEAAMSERLSHYYADDTAGQKVSPMLKKEITHDFSINTMCASLNKIYSTL
jgi:glycosyltransferase involved in cell wall biosynthesis